LSLDSTPFLLLFYLAGLFEIPVCPKGFLLWPLVGTERVGSSPLAPGWYKESLICIIFYFFISHVVISFWRYDNWKYNLLIYLFIILLLFYIILWGRLSDSEYRVRAFSRHSPRALSPREVEFSKCTQGIGARLYENPKFISWVRIHARLGKSQVRGPIMCPLEDGLIICNWDILLGCFDLVPYIYIIPTYFMYRVPLSSHNSRF
jgi:hypothetical protein